MGHRPGFTLIELLVIVTILVVLLALLTPALNKAVYQAELAVCGANLKGSGAGVLSYAMGHRRFYPDRMAPLTPPKRDYPWMPMFQFHDAEGSPDLRPLLKSYFNVNIFCDPLSPRVDFTFASPATRVYGSYTMWFGYRYQANGSLQSSVANEVAPGSMNIQFERGMMKIGDKLGYQGDTFRFLAADLSRFDDVDHKSFASHPDHDGVMASYRFQDERNTGLLMVVSGWASPEPRGPIEMNALADDGSVARYDKVRRDEADTADGRMAKLNQEADHRNVTLFVHLPLR